jgi:glycosyltransferase involved in cell wall biosynthesis
MNPLAMHDGRPLRVLHGTYEIAGQGMMLARALREHGVEARALAYKVDWDGRVPDLVVDLDSHRSALGRYGAKLGAFMGWAPYFDVFHFHYGRSFFNTDELWWQPDLSLLRAMGKLVAFHFHGCEIRRRDHMLANHKLATCTECVPFCEPKRQNWLRAQARKHADLVFFSTLDLAESVPAGIPLPLAIEADRWEMAALAHPLENPEGRDGVRGPVVVAHAKAGYASLELIKGTKHVLAAVEALKPEFPRLELRMIEKRPWATMPEFLSECDILVDQLMMGWYGLLAMEGMCERRAVVAYLRDDFRDRLAGCPIQSAMPDTLAGVLRGLIRDPALRARLGEQGADYVRAHHDLRVVGDRLLRHYRAALDRRAGRIAAAERA